MEKFTHTSHNHEKVARSDDYSQGRRDFLKVAATTAAGLLFKKNFDRLNDEAAHLTTEVTDKEASAANARSVSASDTLDRRAFLQLPSVANEENIPSDTVRGDADIASNTTHERHENMPRTIDWYLTHGKDFGYKNGPALAEAAYHAQLHHLQTYHEREEKNDLLAGAHRITESDPDAIRAIFAAHDIGGDIAFGLPMQESFFTKDAKSNSDALGAYQIKEKTARDIIAQTPELAAKYASLTAVDRKTRTLLQKKLLTDPIFSAEIAATLLADERTRFDGDEQLMVTAYNTGASLKLTPKERDGITYEKFTSLMAQKIADIAHDIRTHHATYVIRKGDTLYGLQQKFPQISPEKLRRLVGGSDKLIAGATTKIPLPATLLTKRILREAHQYIEPLEYAAKVRAAADALGATRHFAYLVKNDHTA